MVPIQKENEAPLGPETRGEENKEEVSSPQPIEVWESVVSSPRGPKTVLFIYLFAQVLYLL